MAVTQIKGSQIQNLTITDAQISSSAAIAYSKLNLSNSIVNADIAAGAAIALSKLAEAVIQADGGQAFTADQSMGGFKLTNLGTPTAAGDAVSKSYVDNLTLGLSWKDSVRAATTTAGTLASSFEDGDTIDGVTLATGDRILIKDQAAPEENGIYVVQATGAPTRATDMDAWSEVPSAAVFIQEGTTLADTGWTCTSNEGGTLDTTAISFVQFTGAASITAGTGLTKSGNTINFNTADTSLTVNADDVAVNLNTTGGLETSTGIRIKLDATTDGYATIATGANGARVVSIKNANIASDAAIAFSKLASLTSANILVGNGSNVATAVAVTGVIALSNAGVTTFNVTFAEEERSGSTSGTWVLANTPDTTRGHLNVFLNGIRLYVGASNDYTISGATITFNSTIDTADRVVATYVY